MSSINIASPVRQVIGKYLFIVLRTNKTIKWPKGNFRVPVYWAFPFPFPFQWPEGRYVLYTCNFSASSLLYSTLPKLGIIKPCLTRYCQVPGLVNSEGLESRGSLCICQHTHSPYQQLDNFACRSACQSEGLSPLEGSQWNERRPGLKEAESSWSPSLLFYFITTLLTELEHGNLLTTLEL